MYRKILVGAVVAGTLVVATPTAAFADGYLDEATQALQSSNLYVSAQVNDLSAEQQQSLASQIDPTSIAIVVLPAGAKSEIADVPNFISTVAQRTGYETVLVSVGGDFEAGSSELPAGLASELANDAESSGDLATSLGTFAQEAIAATPNQPSSGASDAAFDILTPIFLISAGVLFLAVIGVGVVFVRRRFSSGSHEKRYAPEQLQDLLQLIDKHADSIGDRSVVNNLREARTHVQELFKRVKKRIPDQIQQITAQYKGVLKTVAQVSERFADIESHPKYYRNSSTLLRDGQRAIEQYTNGVIQNIQQIEEGSLTDFRVDTKILEGTVRTEEPDYLSIQPTNDSSKKKKG